ncbi:MULTISPECIES: hypothetical protein [unclassified Novosphingobium]|uniref:hypothetical protein n=1 Tax=unclassified Novosphingobium TaxID=2644732 RepID=UPI00135831EE|nr:MULTISPECIES: hypothetical protein [unclassified Novosphingobium]
MSVERWWQVGSKAALWSLALSAPCAALAEEGGESTSPIEVNVVPFVWAPDFKGSMRKGPLAVPLDITAADIAGGVKVGFMGYGDVRTPGFIASGHVLWARFSERSFDPLSGAETRAELTSFEALAGPRIKAGAMEIAPLAGVRHNRLKGVLNPDTPAEIALERGWTTGMVGALVEARVTRSLTLRARGTVGVAGPGDFTSRDLVLLAGYRLAPKISLVGGYRWARERITPRNPESDLGLALDARGPLVALHFGPF